MGTAGVPGQISAGVLGERSRAATLFPALPAVNTLVSNLTTTCVMWRDQNGSSSGKQGQLLWSRPILFISLLRGTPCFSSKHGLKPIYSSPVLPKTMKRFTIHLATQPGTYPCLQAPPTTPRSPTPVSDWSCGLELWSEQPEKHHASHIQCLKFSSGHTEKSSRNHFIISFLTHYIQNIINT